jgi:murein DD-endopeptidase MepM/ murein hydrolase activator NlpD
MSASTARTALAALAALVLVAAAPAADARARWVAPVPGEVVRPFAVGAHPFAPGQHRGVDLAARAGEAVRAACGGRVRFAGAVPGRGRVVTVACGRLVATHLGLERAGVRPGAVVTAGARIGTAGRAGHVQLGARRAGQRHGYVDPLALLAAAPPPLGPAPPARPRGRPVAPARRPPPPPRPAPVAAPAPASPPLAWLGLALVAGAVPLGGIARARRRRAQLQAPGAALAHR